ncbi:MAG TPA: hypothetical protein VE987_00440 [Polyangiaceae bacterium]|nr:hypothetical protein [Polyangiaceae bacterium]
MMMRLNVTALPGLALLVSMAACGGSEAPPGYAGFGAGSSGGQASAGSSSGAAAGGNAGGASSSGGGGPGSGSGSGMTSGSSSGGASGSGTGSSGSAGDAGSSATRDASADGTAGASADGGTYTNPFGCKFGWGEPAPSPITSANALQFVTSWAGYEIAADASISSCNNCTGFLKQVAGTNLVPAYYAYLIGYYGHVNNLPDQNCCPGPNSSCVTCTATQPNLTTGMAYLLLSDPNGANAPCGSTTQFCAQNKIVQAYAYYAQQTAKAWPTKPLLWLLEGDFIQYTDTTQVSSVTSTTGTKVGLTMAQIGQLAALIVSAIKTNMPNAIVGIDHSNWIGSAQAQQYWSAMAPAGYDIVWTTGPANNNGTVGAGVTYANLHAWTGRKIYVDEWTPDTWSNQSAATINPLIGAGVIALNANSPPASYTSAVTALEPQLASTCP